MVVIRTTAKLSVAMTPSITSRRRILKSVGAVTIGGLLAGCTDNGDGDDGVDGGDGGDTTPMEETTEEPAGTTEETEEITEEVFENETATTTAEQ